MDKGYMETGQSTKLQVMGILNVTPDSFSDGGSFTNDAAIISQVDQMVADGVDIIDVGGESTRPFAEPVSAEEELARVIPAITRIRERCSLPTSIDTTKAVVAEQALAAGADMINDISALRMDPEMIRVVREYSGPVIIMHMQGTPGNMQVNPSYENVIVDINDFFAERIQWMEQQGVHRDRIVVDPGVGFGKTLEHNLTILRNVQRFKEHGCRVMIGHSRKSFFDKLLGVSMEERDCPTAVVSAFCARQGADFLRVHDVGKTVQAVRIAAAFDR